MRRTSGAHARLGVVQVCAAGVLWGSGGLVVTVLRDRVGFGAMTTSAWRVLLAALALLAFGAMTHRVGHVAAAFRADPVRVALVGCGTAAYQGFYFVSVLLVGVSVATVVSLGLAPTLTATWEHARRRTRPNLRELAVLGAALTGLVLITVTAGHGVSRRADNPSLGMVFAVAAGTTYAATTMLGHTLAKTVDAVALTTGATLVGAVALSPFLAAAAFAGRPTVTSDPGSIALLLYLGVATMALSYGLLYAGLKTTSGSAATVATLVEPLSAALLAAMLLSERLPPLGIVGGALILVAVLGLRSEHAPPPAV